MTDKLKRVKKNLLSEQAFDKLPIKETINLIPDEMKYLPKLWEKISEEISFK
jgi:hypothetical protein